MQGHLIMKETECQQLVIDAVEDEGIGGRGLKFNNRFVIGIPDLLIKLPAVQPVILEAKLFTFSQKTLENGHLIQDIGATKLQKDQLRDWGYAGMLTGVVLFIVPTGGNVSGLMMTMRSYDEMDHFNWSIDTDHFRPLGGKHERLQNIRQQLIEFGRD
jgi:hypothetical protein